MCKKKSLEKMGSIFPAEPKNAKSICKKILGDKWAAFPPFDVQIKCEKYRKHFHLFSLKC